MIELEITKSGKRRTIPLNERADAVLARRAKQRAERAVFNHQAWDHFRSAWEYALKRAKVTALRPHDLWHTFASWAVQRGVRLPELKDLLGHTTLAMTMRYAHLAPENLRRASGRLDGVLDVALLAEAGAPQIGEDVAHGVTHEPSAEVTPSVLPIEKSLQELPY